MVPSRLALPRSDVALLAILAALAAAVALTEAPPGPAGPHARPLTPVVLAWLAAAAVVLGRRRVGLAAFAAALAARLLFPGPDIHLHDGKPYRALVAVVVPRHAHPLYGDLWETAADLAGRAWHHPDAAHGLGVLASALGVALWAVGARAVAGRRAGLAAAVTLAGLPWLVAIARTTAFPNLTAPLLGGVLVGLARPGLAPALLGGTSAGLIAHARPELVPLAGLGALILLLARRWLAGGVAAALVAWRLPALLGALGSAGDAPHGLGSWVTSPGRLLGKVLPGGVLADPTVLPVALVPLAVVGVALGRGRARALTVGCVALGVALAALYLPQATRADQLRFHAVALPAWGTAAALGVVALGERRRIAGAVGALALGASFLAAARPYGDRFVWQHEHEVLRRVLPTLPAGSEVLASDALDGAHDVGRYVGAIAPVTWSPRPAEVPPGALVWVGAADHRAEGKPPDWDRLEPVDVVEVPLDLGGFPARGEGGTVPVGLYRAR